MAHNARYIRSIETVRLTNLASVGGKIAGLGELAHQLTTQTCHVPPGFAVTVDAYTDWLTENAMTASIFQLAEDTSQTITQRGTAIRTKLQKIALPMNIQQEIIDAYAALCTAEGKPNVPVAVRSSATAEDLPTASFAGQQDSFLNVTGADDVVAAVHACMISLFNDRALEYRTLNNIRSEDVKIAVCVQLMINTNTGASGVIFTLDPETGHPGVITITGSYGLGEPIVQGTIDPDQWTIAKQPRDCNNKLACIRANRGTKTHALMITPTGTELRPVVADQQTRWCISDDIVQKLAECALYLEQQFGHALDIEWAHDGTNNHTYIVQARPETVHSAHKRQLTGTSYQLTEQPHAKPLLTGAAIGTQIVTGTVKLLSSPHEAQNITKNDIIVTTHTNPDWTLVLQKAGGLITNTGGRTSHAAIVSRELNIPAIVGTQNATQTLKNGQRITIDCSDGITGDVYDGALAWTTQTYTIVTDTQPPVPLMLNIGDPDGALSAAMLPSAGAGLVRIEFVMSTAIGIHPSVPEYWKILDSETQDRITKLIEAHPSLEDFLISKLAEALSFIGTVFYPRHVIVRFSDFKSNEYKNLIGGSFIEPQEENPMLGLRGAARYITPPFDAAFKRECAALQYVRQKRNLTNVHPMIPFVRSPTEAQQVVALLDSAGLTRQNRCLRFMMLETPENMLNFDAYSSLFDGFSIGSNDLTQLTLGVDRDNGAIKSLYQENNPASNQLIRMALEKAHACNKPVGICGAAGADPAYARQLIEWGISSISVSPPDFIPLFNALQTKPG